MAIPTMKKKIIFGCLLPTMNKVCLFFFFNKQMKQKQLIFLPCRPHKSNKNSFCVICPFFVLNVFVDVPVTLKEIEIKQTKLKSWESQFFI